MTIPSAAYRIQFNSGFNFSDLGALMDYLHDLGITAIYASPILQASKGSNHNYDIINPDKINEDLGTEDDLAVLAAELHRRKISWIQDIVPNHMNFDISNIWLKDVLERGINSSYAHYFDIDWEHPYYPGKLMIPFLECHLKDCLVQDKFSVIFEETGFFITYYDKRYPVNIENYPLLLSGTSDDESDHINAAVSSLLSNNQAPFDHWNNMKEELLKKLLEEPRAGRIRQKLETLNRDHELLSQILYSQHYILCDYRDSDVQINYRRFFNVNSLICLRMEDEKVFHDYHRYIHNLYTKGFITGLRIDHVDGLRNPKEYVDRLRSLFGPDCYIIVEKILDIKEDLPEMDIQGTSGYEFLSYISQVVTDFEGSQKLLEFYKTHVPEFSDYDAIVYEKKFHFLETYLNGEWDNLLRLLLSLNIIEDEEIKTGRLKHALGVLMAAFPVYRAYINDLPAKDHDAEFIETAFRNCYLKAPDHHYELDVLKQLFEPDTDPVLHQNRLNFLQRLMQFTGPLAAKGVEDTTFFLYNVLISHNEVGDEPCVLGIPVRQFHDKMIRRQQKNPLSLNCTSTHDTKRGEDNRMRINIISELADEWIELVNTWQKINDPFRRQLEDVRAPIINDEYYLYQTLVGGFPENLDMEKDDFKKRTRTFFIKVLRESKLMSDYITPNAGYEEASLDFIDHLLNPGHEFLPSILPFIKKIIRYANTYVMLQAIVKTTAPGIPEIYRGCELWDLSYVDPDNRRPVDFALRQELLSELNRLEAEEGVEKALEYAVQHLEIGAQKLFVTKEILNVRKYHNDVFIKGAYLPVYPVEGEDQVISYCRHFGDEWVLVVLPLGIVHGDWKDTVLELPPEAPDDWCNIFTNEKISGKKLNTNDIFKSFPVAVFRPVKS